MFKPHQVLQHLSKCGLRIDEQVIREYWEHLKSVGYPQALQIEDTRLIPILDVHYSVVKACMRMHRRKMYVESIVHVIWPG